LDNALESSHGVLDDRLVATDSNECPLGECDSAWTSHLAIPHYTSCPCHLVNLASQAVEQLVTAYNHQVQTRAKAKEKVLTSSPIRILRIGGIFIYTPLMKLIIGIGNPDPQYAETRHNVGWQFLDWLNKKYKGEKFEENKKLLGSVAKVEIEDIKAWLMKPSTYVNESGKAVAKTKPWAKAKNDDIVIVHDDLDIPFGMCKRSFEKSSGGHKGVESIIKALKTTKFHRIRIGTGMRSLDKAREQSDKKRDEFVKDFVLHSFTPAQKDELKGIFKECEIRLLQALKQ
jgi:PTH1 family peptidyl-tRNA hydrolase